MNFETVTQNIIDILGNAENGRYRTIGYKDRATSADEILNELRTVQVFYSDGNFPQSAGRMTAFKHKIEFVLLLSTSKATTVDVAVLDSPTSTPAEKAAALLGQRNAENEVSLSNDELFSHVWNEIMDMRNFDLGAPGIVSNRMIEGRRKGTPSKHGDLVVIMSEVRLTLDVPEIPVGEPLINELEVIDNEIEIPDDDTQQTGTSVDYTEL